MIPRYTKHTQRLFLLVKLAVVNICTMLTDGLFDNDISRIWDGGRYVFLKEPCELVLQRWLVESSPPYVRTASSAERDRAVSIAASNQDNPHLPNHCNIQIIYKSRFE